MKLRSWRCRKCGWASDSSPYVCARYCGRCGLWCMRTDSGPFEVLPGVDAGYYDFMVRPPPGEVVFSTVVDDLSHLLWSTEKGQA